MRRRSCPLHMVLKSLVSVVAVIWTLRSMEENSRRSEGGRANQVAWHIRGAFEYLSRLALFLYSYVKKSLLE